jgi:hypothetical protein
LFRKLESSMPVGESATSTKRSNAMQFLVSNLQVAGGFSWMGLSFMVYAALLMGGSTKLEFYYWISIVRDLSRSPPLASNMHSPLPTLNLQIRPRNSHPVKHRCYLDEVTREYFKELSKARNVLAQAEAIDTGTQKRTNSVYQTSEKRANSKRC